MTVASIHPVWSSPSEVSMPQVPPRRLNLLDGMIVIAAVAVGIALTRLYVQAHFPSVPSFDARPSWIVYFRKVEEVARVAMIWLGVASPALLVIQLRRPRGGWRRALRRPGTAASLVATLLVAVELADWAIAAGVERAGFTHLFDALPFDWRLAPAGAAVAAVWTWAILIRGWRPERSLIDRAGRLVGAGWIVVFLALLGATTLERLRENLQAIRFQATVFAPVNDRYLEQLRANEAAHQTYVQQQRQYYRDRRAELEDIIASGDPGRMKADLEGLLGQLKQERLEFEAEEKSRFHPASTTLPPPPPDLPFPPDLSMPPRG